MTVAHNNAGMNQKKYFDTSPRFMSLDISKAFGIVQLICLHQVIISFFLDDTGIAKYFESIQFDFVGYDSGLHLLGFQIPLLAGTTFYLTFKHKQMSWKNILIRSGLLMALGFIMNFFSWYIYEPSSDIQEIFIWDVLQFIALSMCISYPILKHIPSKINMLLFTVLGVLTLFSKFIFHFQNTNPGTYLHIIFFGDVLGQNYWPISPWFSLFCAGIFMGKIFYKDKNLHHVWLIISGVILFMISLMSGEFMPIKEYSNVWGASLFRPSYNLLLGIIGFSFAFNSSVHLFLKKYPNINTKLQSSPLRYFSFGILWIYIFSTILGGFMRYMTETYATLSFQQAHILFYIFLSLQIFMAYTIGKFIFYKKTSQHLQ